MTFLKKLGSFLAQGIALATGIWPLVSPLFGSKAQGAATTVINDLTAVGGVVVQAEALLQGAGNGAAKLEAAAPLVANIVKTSELVSGHKIANEALFLQGCTDLTHAVAEILNSLDPGAVQASGKAVTMPPPSVVPSVVIPPPVAVSVP